MADRVVRRPGRAGRARAHLWPARGAPHPGRSRGDRRAGRRRLAAGGAHRSVAQPPDAPSARPRPAGAPHRSLGARLRPDARRARGDPEPRRQARRRAGGGVALRAAARRGRRRSALGRGGRARRAVSRDGARARPRRRESTPIKAPEPRPPRAARPTALVGHRDRALAARPLHDLRQAHPAARAPRSGRHAAVGRRPRQRDPRRRRPLRADVPGRAARRRACRADARSAARNSPRSTIFPRRARCGGRASSASRAGSIDWERERRPDLAEMRAEIRGEISASGRRAAASASTAAPTASSGAATAATPSSISRPATRRAPRRCASASRRSSRSRPRSCGAAGSRDFDPACRSTSSLYVKLKGGEPAGEPMPGRPQGSLARRGRRPRARQADRARAPGSRTRRRPTARWCCRCGRNRYGTYDDLARVKEWSAGGDADEEVERMSARAIPDAGAQRARPRPPIRRSRPSCRPMRAPARPTCWRSG